MSAAANTIPRAAVDALRLHALGFYLLVLHWVREDGSCSCHRGDCRSGGKHPIPANGLHSATRDLHRIQAWMAEYPNANWGIACGPSGIYVVDIDVKAGGDVSDTL